MKTNHLMACAGVALLLSACIPSVNPFYLDRDVVFEPRLLGEWQSKEPSKETAGWKFEAGEEKTYKVTITEAEDKKGKFSGHLFKLKGGYFMDLLPADCDYAANQIDMVGAAMYPGHLLVRLPQLEPELKLAFFDFEWLENIWTIIPKTWPFTRNRNASS